MSKVAKHRMPAMEDIERELRDARHYLRLLREHERKAGAAYEAGDVAGLKSARDSFLRDLGASLNAARTARNYLLRLANASGERKWIDAQLAPPSYKFHADVAGNAFHEGAIQLTRMLGRNVPGNTKFHWVHGPDRVRDIVPIMSNLPRKRHQYTDQIRYIYDERELGPVLATVLSSVTRERRAVVDLLDEHIFNLERVFKDGVRNARLTGNFRA